jgi:hypothetical protein
MNINYRKDSMDKLQAVGLLQGVLSEIALSDGSAATERFSGLRDVDGKTREVKMILDGLDGLPPTLVACMGDDIDFQANSRRIRLEALARYIRSALKFVDTGAFEKPKKIIHAPPDFSRLTSSVPGLQDELEKRWREAQRCAHVEAYTAAVIMMGSILEGLLLARAQQSVSTAFQSARAPRDKTGKSPAIHDWNLSTLIDVAVDVGWLKTDRGKFSHALRDSRNVVHPWQAVMSRANFDQATCKTSWHVLDASVEDLLKSMS